MREAPDCTPQQLDAAMDAAAEAFRGWRTRRGAPARRCSPCADALKAAADEIAPILTAEQGKPLARRPRGLRRGDVVPVLRRPRDPARGAAGRRRRASRCVRRPLGVVGRDHAVELPGRCSRSWKIAPGAARRQHGGAQAVAVHAALDAEARRDPERRAAARRAQRRQRRRRARRVDDGAPGAPQDLLHRLGRDRQEGRGRRRAGPEARHARARRQRPGDRARRRRPRRTVADKLFWGAFATPARSARRSSASTCTRRCTTDVVDGARRAGPRRSRSATASSPTAARPDQQQAAVRARQRARRRREDAGGAAAAAGGGRWTGDGYFFQPTIVTDVADGVRLVDEEQFGPALPIITYRDVDDAVERANATHFGLPGSVWSPTPSARRRSPSGSSAAPPG